MFGRQRLQPQAGAGGAQQPIGGGLCHEAAAGRDRHRARVGDRREAGIGAGDADIQAAGQRVGETVVAGHRTVDGVGPAVGHRRIDGAAVGVHRRGVRESPGRHRAGGGPACDVARGVLLVRARCAHAAWTVILTPLLHVKCFAIDRCLKHFLNYL